MEANDEGAGSAAPETPEPRMSPPVEMWATSAERSSWPIGLGVVGLLLSGLGLLCGCAGMATPLFWPAYIDWLDDMDIPEEQMRLAEASQPPMVWTVFASLIGLTLAIILLIASINLLRRRASGVGLYKFWAWITIPWSVIGFLVNLLIQMQLPADVREAAGAGMAFNLAFGGCMILVLGIGYPLFALLWLMREKTKDEVAAWAAESRAMI